MDSSSHVTVATVTSATVETPRVETPVVEAPVVEAPVVEAPVVGVPLVEHIGVDVSKDTLELALGWHDTAPSGLKSQKAQLHKSVSEVRFHPETSAALAHASG